MMKKIISAIEKYNRYHSPEATAKFIKLNENSATIEFSGPFCRSCGVSEWFEDFRIELENEGVSAKVVDLEEKDDGYLVKFKIEKYK